MSCSAPKAPEPVKAEPEPVARQAEPAPKAPEPVKAEPAARQAEPVSAPEEPAIRLYEQFGFFLSKVMRSWFSELRCRHCGKLVDGE